MSIVTRIFTAAALSTLGLSAVALRADDSHRAAQNPAFPVLRRVFPEIMDLPLSTYAQLSTDFARLRVTAISNIVRQGALPCTAYRCDVLDSIRGAATGSIEVLVGGGISDVQHVVVMGAPKFGIGDVVAAFLVHTEGTTDWSIAGLSEGVYRLEGAEANTVVYGKHAASSESYPSLVDRIRSEISKNPR